LWVFDSDVKFYLLKRGDTWAGSFFKGECITMGWDLREFSRVFGEL